MTAVIILQARTSSSRLPGKALLPVGGYPSAILAGLRASSRGRPLVLATSDDPSDGRLASEAQRHGLGVFRGPLDDVLARYFLASSQLSEDSAVVRLTGDNVVPDGAFVEEMLAAFAASGAEYMGTDEIGSRLPYGLSAEVFSVAALGKAHASATSRVDREHVGPWIQRNGRSAVFVPSLTSEDFSHLRCTIDDEDDYQLVVRLFEGVKSPPDAGWLDLARKLATLPGQPTFRVPWRRVGGALHSEMVLGTAQLGMAYGRMNSEGQPARSEAISIARRAIAHGVASLDTARGYGESESVLGEALEGAWRSRARVVTKLDLDGLTDAATEAEVFQQVDASIEASCHALRTEKLDTLLLHGWAYRCRWRGAGWLRALHHRDKGRITSLGASVYAPEEAMEALQDPNVKHLQIPINLLDWRWKPEVARASMARPDVVVHARSTLLQGILAHPESQWPYIPGFDSQSCRHKLTGLAEKLGRQGVVDLCLAYVRSFPWITSLVVGCETMAQLDQNLHLFLQTKLTPEQCAEIDDALPRAPEELLNPAKWGAALEQAHAS